MERSKKMLSLCVEGKSTIGIEYAVIEVLELNSLHIVPKRELQIAAGKNLWKVKLDNQKTCHALILFTGEKEPMQKRLRDLIRYRSLKKQYKHFATSTQSTQTEPQSMEQSIPSKGPLTEPQIEPPMEPKIVPPADYTYNEPPMEPQIEPPLVQSTDQESGVNVEESTTWDEPNEYISPLLPVFLKSIKNQDDEFSMAVTQMPKEGINDDVEPTIDNVTGPSSSHDDALSMEVTGSSVGEGADEDEPTIINVPGPSMDKDGTKTGHSLAEVEKLHLKSNLIKKSRSKKKHFCKYCKKLVGNFSRHITIIHSNDNDVGVYMNMKNKKEKQIFIRKIMADGDSLYNEKNPDNPIVRRASGVILQNRTKCPKCKQLVSEKHAVEHLRKCNPDSTFLPGSSLRAEIYRENIKLHETLNDDMKERIIPNMRNDSIRSLCETDSSLILYGNKMCERLKGERQEKTIRNHLRILGRVSQKVINENATISSTAEIFDPKHYNSFVNAIFEICGFGRAEGQEMEKPTTPHQYGPKMKDLSEIILTELLKKVNPENENVSDQMLIRNEIKKIKAWQEIYKRDFDKQIASLGRKQADRRTFMSKQLTPSMDDVQKLLTHIEDMKTTSFNNLKAVFNVDDYLTLSKCLLLKLWIFNRRRVGEVDDMELKSWVDAKDVDETSDQFKSLNPTEQRFASSFRRMCVVSKLRRPAAILLPKKDIRCFELIISLREKARVPKDNVYLFAVNDRHIEGTSTMNEFAKNCGATNWKLLTGTRLRKQLAASLRYLNLTEEDLRLVAESMGHTEKTHITKYRTHDPALHAGRMSRVLMAIDDGTINQYAGKSIDDLDDKVEIEPPNRLEVLHDVEAFEGSSVNISVSNVEATSETEDSTDNVQLKKVPFRRKLKFDSGSSDEEFASSRGNTPGRKRTFAKRKPHNRNRLSQSLKEALQNEMADEIKEKKCPSTTRILQAIASLEPAFPEIVGHSPKKLKSLVSNWSRRK